MWELLEASLSGVLGTIQDAIGSDPAFVGGASAPIRSEARTPHVNGSQWSGGVCKHVPLQPDTDLGLAILIAEDDDGRYEPVAVVGSIAEGREIAASDLRGRMRRVERNEEGSTKRRRT